MFIMITGKSYICIKLLNNIKSDVLQFEIANINESDNLTWNEISPQTLLYNETKNNSTDSVFILLSITYLIA